MDIVLGVMGVVIIVLLLVVAVLVFKKKPEVDTADYKKMEERLIRMEGEIAKLNPEIDRNFRENRKEIAENLERLQNGNEKKLEEMRETVDEKLKASVEKRFNESFKAISEQLSEVYKGLGEMKGLANGVGDLKKVMEGVKTRGIYGEVQLGAIIEDVLSKNQYEENIITKAGSNDRVEFAVKMPGKETDVFLPISKIFYSKSILQRNIKQFL